MRQAVQLLLHGQVNLQLVQQLVLRWQAFRQQPVIIFIIAGQLPRMAELI